MSTREMTTLEAMADCLRVEMRRDPSVVYLGEGTGERGGTYGHTLGLYQEFGPERMIDMPISELGFTGAAIGAAVNGLRPIADLMFMDFAAEAMSQIVNQAAKLRYMSNGRLSVPMVVWAGVGAVKSAGPHHSGCLYPWFMHVPGLKVVLPSNPADFKGLLAAAIRDNDPVVFCAHKLLFPRRGLVPEGEHVIPIGAAALRREGHDATLVAAGYMVSLALEAAERLSAEGVECEVLDLRTLAPIDAGAIVASAAKTGRVLVVDEAYSPCGVGAEVAAVVNERAFRFLRAPVLRLHTAHVSHPFSPAFDPRVLPQVEGILDRVRLLLDGGVDAGAGMAGAGASRARSVEAAGMERPAGASALPPPASDAGDRIAVRIPNQGLTVEEARIVRWLVRPGEQVRADQPLFEIETDKVLVEVNAEGPGVVEQIVAQPDDVLPLGAVVAWLRSSSR